VADASSTQPLRGRVAVVTGASRGIGRAICLAFAAAGADIVAAARSTDAAPSKLPGTIESVAREVEALGGRAIAVRTDVADEASVDALLAHTIEAFGRADILVNNAAYMYRAPLLDMPLTRWDRVFEVNLRGAVICARAFAREMSGRSEGRIISVTSSAASMALPDVISYAASKAALEALTRGLAAELAPSGIAVNALRIDRAVLTEGALYLNPEGDYEGWETPQAVARAALWLATQERTFTGQIVESSQAGAG
jgi:NAD(P)-dependent dehydrogenase (short-subunit alcohol dehydrogenase family)